MRRGELLALRWSDVNLTEEWIKVRRSLEQVGGNLSFKEPKSKSARRRITISNGTIDTLRLHKGKQSELRLKLGLCRENNGLIFSNIEGGPLDANSVSKKFKKLVRTLDIPKVTFHGLRHTHITHLLMDGEPINAVSARAGHSTVSITLDINGHVMPDNQKGLAMRYEDDLLVAIKEQDGNSL